MNVQELEMRRLPLLCPQDYAPDMRVVPCNRCSTGWDKQLGKCAIPTGCEHLPLEVVVPDCPIQDRCRHQVQQGDAPCVVRARGLVCESAFTYAGESDPAGHPLAFNADFVASPEEVAEWE